MGAWRDGSFFAHRQLHLRFLLTGASLRLDIGRCFCDFYRPSALRAAACLSKAVKFAQLRVFMFSRGCARSAPQLLVFRAQASVLKFYKIYAQPRILRYVRRRIVRLKASYLGGAPLVPR